MADENLIARVDVAVTAVDRGPDQTSTLTVDDAIVSGDPDGARWVAARMSELLTLIGGRQPQREAEDPLLSDAFFGLSPVLEAWRTVIPSAAALHPLYGPTETLADGTPLDEVASRIFTHTLDGRGIRSRGAVLAWLLEHEYRERVAGTWASLACGAGVPVCRGAAGLRAADGPTEILLLDRDRSALDLTLSVATREGVDGLIRPIAADVLDVEAVHRAVEPGSCAVVECLGFFEYLPTNPPAGWIGAADFLSIAWALVKPGGVLLFANMLDTHPELPFTMHAVRWPYIVPRSVEDVREVVSMAGLERDALEVWLPDDGVYAVYALTKAER